MEPFDPYKQWLGIDPVHQPPNLYVLLGLKRFEADPAVIRNAAQARLALVRPHKTGPQAEAAMRLEQELLLANSRLSDARRKAAYDAALHSAQAAYEAMLKAAQAETAANLPVTPAAGKAASSPNQPNSATADRNVGKHIGKYRLLERSANSSTGPVYKAQHIGSGAIVALKLLKPTAASKTEVLKRFKREFKVTKQLSHSNLVAGFELGEDGDIHFLSMEYVGGADLAQIIQQHGPLPVEAVVEFIRAAAEGLAYLHSQGIYHRNVKPENLIVNHRGQIKISNLILAKLDDDGAMADGEDLTRPGQMIGTVDYLAPEQATDASSIDGRADVYSLGCVMFNLLTAQIPYPGKGMIDKLMAHRTGPIPSLTQIRPDVPPWLDKVFQKMVAKEPADRYANMEQVAQALEQQDNMNQRQLGLIAAVVGAVLLVAVALLIWFTR